jgi:hypothetical protein
MVLPESLLELLPEIFLEFVAEVVVETIFKVLLKAIAEASRPPESQVLFRPVRATYSRRNNWSGKARGLPCEPYHITRLFSLINWPTISRDSSASGV